MKRRPMVIVCGSAVLAGCVTLTPRSSDVPTVEDSQVSVLDRTCDESVGHEATATFEGDGSRISVTGILVVPRSDVELLIDVRDGTGVADRAADVMELRIDYDPLAEDADSDVLDCSGMVEYEATVDFSRPPSSVIVRHVTETDDEYVLETITTATPSD